MYAKNIWKDITEQKKKAIFDFGKDYIEYLTASKTERLAVKEAEALARKNGFLRADEIKEFKAGTKVYFTNMSKNIALYIIGKKPVTEGIRILGAHVDAPRLDLKQNPLYKTVG